MNNPQYQNERDYRFDPQSNAPFYPTHPQQSSSITPIPGAVLAIGIMAIVDAVFSGLATIGWFITICGIPLGIYSLVAAVMAGIYAYKLLSNPPRPLQPSKTLAILQIINIITGNIFSLVFGILSLVFYNQPEVQSYFAYRNGSPTSPFSYQ